jgi:hypothetical protein
MDQRKRLTDILSEGERRRLFGGWKDLKAAGDFAPIPKGEYVCHIVEGVFDKSENNKPYYRLTFEVIEGEYAGRRCWHKIWLTEAARPQAKRDFDKLGITDPETQLEKGIPLGVIRCRVKLVLRTKDDGAEFNEVKAFDVIGIDEGDAFEPEDVTPEDRLFDPSKYEKNAQGEEPPKAPSSSSQGKKSAVEANGAQLGEGS